MQYRLHIDGGGANCSIADQQEALLHYRQIKPYSINGISNEGAALVCTRQGYLPWKAPDGLIILIKCYYSPSAADTIISPTDIVLNHLSRFKAWTQYSDLTTGSGYIEFESADDGANPGYPLTWINGLWYHHTEPVSNYNPDKSYMYQPIINCLNAAGQYELFHAQLGHPGTSVMTSIQIYVDGVPKLKVPPLFKCDACLCMKATKHAVTVQAVQEALWCGLSSDTKDDALAVQEVVSPGEDKNDKR
jgi:hypothetical protein